MEARSASWHILLGLVLVSLHPGARAEVLSMDSSMESRSVAQQMRYLAPDEELNPVQALERIRENGRPVRDEYPFFGFSENPMWFLLELQAPAAPFRWFLEVSRPVTDQITLYRFNDDNELVDQWQSGETLARHERPMHHPHLVFPFEFTGGETTRLLMRVKSDNILDMPATLYSTEGFRQHQASSNLVSGAYFGIVAIMCLYNLMIFFSIRDRSYLFYVLYLGTFGLMILHRQGLGLQWLWPEAAWWNHHAQPVLLLGTLAFSTLFAHSFLGLRRSNPRIARAFRGVAAVFLVTAPIAMFNVELWLRFGSFVLLPWTLLIIGMAVARALQGFVSARYFLLAYSAVAAVAVLFWLRTLGIIESSPFLEYSLQGATALEALLLSFALAHRMTALKQENERIQKQATEELEQRVHERTRELHQALNARSEFLATISHEVRTPLNGILGNIDLIRDKGLDEDQSRHLRVIEQSGYTLLHLINDVLDYAKIEAGRMELEQHSFDLRTLVHDCIQLFEQKARENRVELNMDMPDGGERPVSGDSLRLRQILSNLISNAIKFTLDGEVRIRVRHEPDNTDYVLFEVIDTGTGIDRDRAERLFEHFYQLDASTSRRHGGTGLGLAISRQLVELMGGEIDVDSEPGKGSRFWFRVPLPPAERVEADRKEAVEPDAAYTPARLLVVDDNHTNLMVAQGQCQKLGHEVLTAESGTEAIAVLLGTARMPDVILMDCEMPDMDGFETTAEIRRLQAEGRVPDIPVVALTAHAVPDKIRACHDAGMVSHIAKPVRRDKLGREIEHALHNQYGTPDNSIASRAG